MISDSNPAKMSNLRRSQRVCLSIPVAVIKPNPGGTATTEETCTLIVSAHGALLLLHMPVRSGELVMLKHKKSLEELVCRVVSFGAEQSGKHEVGIEFEHPAPRFWRIAFPPSDWSPRSPDAKVPTRQLPGTTPPQAKAAAVGPESEKKLIAKPQGPDRR